MRLVVGAGGIVLLVVLWRVVLLKDDVDVMCGMASRSFGRTKTGKSSRT